MWRWLIFSADRATSLQVTRHFGKHSIEVGSDDLQRRNDRNRDQRGDESVFDSRGA
jgi:hypothetical protein